MEKSFLPVTRPNRPTGTRPETPASPEPRTPARAGQIGPIRREIIFEPVHERPAPAEPAPAERPPAAPETQPREPVPDRS
jgi:hypothetical protein